MLITNTSHSRSNSAMLLFICGFPGGGTDLIKTILNAHPDVFINGEMPFLANLTKYGIDHSTTFSDNANIKSFQLLLKRLDVWGNLNNIEYDFSSDLHRDEILTIEDILRICFSKQNKQVWGNKTPQNTENIDLLNQLFPKARFLIITRDVRDVCLSWKNKWSKDMVFCAQKWADRMGKGWISTALIQKERYLYVKFEDILDFPDKEIREICRFMDIPFSERMLEHHRFTEQDVDGKLNYGEPIIMNNKEKWKFQLSKKLTTRIEEIAYDTMNILGYERAYASNRRSITRSEILRGRFWDSLTMLFVGNVASKHNTFRNRLNFVTFEIRKLIMKRL